jgi:DNA-binding ferritin-like protein
MLDLAVSLLCLKLYAHKAHHVAARVAFIPDHEMLGEIYEMADSHYDDVLERFIGTHGDEALDEQRVIEAAVQKCAKYPIKGVKENKEYFKVCIESLNEINSKIEALCKKPEISQGTIQLVGDIANKNEVILYKIKQRCK